MARPLVASTYCSPACLHSRTQPQPFVAVSVSGSILPKSAALIKTRSTAVSAVQSLAHPSISFSMSRRTRSPVVAKVSQTESKPNNKQEGQPPEDNFYIVVILCLTYMLKLLHKHHQHKHWLTRQIAQCKYPLLDSLHRFFQPSLDCWYASYITLIGSHVMCRLVLQLPWQLVLPTGCCTRWL